MGQSLVMNTKTVALTPGAAPRGSTRRPSRSRTRSGPAVVGRPIITIASTTQTVTALGRDIVQPSAAFGPLLHPAGKPVLIVLLADVFHQVVARLNQRRLKGHRKRPRVGTRIIDGYLAHQMTGIHPRPPFDRVQLLRMGRRSSIEPELVVEPDGVDDEGVVLVPTDGMTEPGWLEFGGMLAAVQKDLAERSHPLGQDVHMRWLLVRVVLDEPERIRTGPQQTQRQAPVDRIISWLAGCHERLRGRQQRELPAAGPW